MAQTQTGEGAGTNVLDVLDQRQPTAFYWELTILACLGGAPGAAGTVDWRLILGLGAAAALIGLALRTQMPESPRWLLRQGKYKKVRDAMKEFGAEVTTEDVEQTARQLQAEDQRREQTKARNWTAGVRAPSSWSASSSSSSRSPGSTSRCTTGRTCSARCSRSE